MLFRSFCATQNYLREPQTYSFGLDAIDVKETTTSARMAWSTIREIRETKSLFLLYHASYIAIVVPKRFFAGDNDLREWKDLIAQAFPKASQEAPRLADIANAVYLEAQASPSAP
jgi:hypothetical protein